MCVSSTVLDSGDTNILSKKLSPFLVASILVVFLGKCIDRAEKITTYMSKVTHKGKKTTEKHGTGEEPDPASNTV